MVHAVARSLRRSAQQPKPNILFILADNIGYGDIGVYGGGELRGAPTPRIDQLAAEGLAADAVPGRAGLHAIARRIDDRTLFHPVRTVAGRGRGYAHLAAGDGNHHGRDAARRRLCHRDLWQVASRRAALQPAAEQGLRRVLRHPAGGHLGRLPDDSPGPQTKTLDIPLDKGPQIVEAKRGEPLKAVKPYTEEVRRDIDWELVDRGIDFMKRQKAAGKPFFLYLPISRTHFPNLPSKRFEGHRASASSAIP